MLTIQNAPDWRQVQRRNFTQWEMLADFLELTSLQRGEILHKSGFPLNLPYRLAEKIEKGNLQDPILKQFLPTRAELRKTAGFCFDPVGDETARQQTKLLHKYEGRVLLVTTSACAMHCRYCFRQNFDYEAHDRSFDAGLALIENDPTIREVILSGGDPLSLSDEALQSLLEKISGLPHITCIRFHTRFPIAIPERITDAFLAMLSKLKQQVFFVIHANHPRELDMEVMQALQFVQKAGAVLLCQSVLLKGVNNDFETLKALCERLTDHGVIPYYLHQLDRVQGAAHFEVPEKEGLKLMQKLRESLPGYAVPRYVREIAGEKSKTPL